MRALVTGSGGFVGRYLVAHLEAEGDDVTALDSVADAPVDVTDADAVGAALAAARPDAVYHLAALSHVGRSWDDPVRTFRVNAEGTLNVLRACTEAEVERVLVTSSAETYGAVAPEDLPITEDLPLRPLSPYAVSKSAADQLALQAFLGAGLATLRVRAFNHTGPGQSTDFVVGALAARVVAAERAADHRAREVRVGSLDAVRDLSDVRDVVRAYRLLVTHGAPGAAYNVCTGRGIAVGEVADTLLGQARQPLRLVTDPDLVRPVDIPALIGDPTRLHAATGWEPAIPLDQTLADMLDAARTRA